MQQHNPCGEIAWSRVCACAAVLLVFIPTVLTSCQQPTGGVYAEGERIPTSDPCIHCVCDFGETVCAAVACAYPRLPHPSCVASRAPGECCPTLVTCQNERARFSTRPPSAPPATPTQETSTDARTDAETDAETDARTDAETDARADAGTGAGIDATTDAGAGAGIDATTDAGAGAGIDAGTDAPRRASDSCYSDSEQRRYEHGDAVMTSDPCLHCRCRRGLIACASEQCGYPPLPHPSCSTQRIPGTCCGATISCPPYQYKPTTATADIQSSSEPLLRVNPEYVDGLGHGISKQTPSGFFRRRSGTGRKEISGDIVNP